MMCNRFSDFNVKSDKGKTPLIVLRCADNRQLFEGTGKGNGKAMKYAIYEGNIDRLEKKLKRISNKCKAYGCDFHYEQTGEEFRELKDEKGNKYTARFVLVEAEGTAIINDWEFIAELEHTENGNIITGVAGLEVPERYYTSKPMCEHCNSMEESEVVVLQDQPCRLSFEKLQTAIQSESAATITQSTKLFVSPDVTIKAGSKLTVTQDNVTTDYTRSGVPSTYPTHQEITLELFKEYA